MTKEKTGKKIKSLGMEERIEIPTEITFSSENHVLTMKKGNKEIKRQFDRDLLLSSEGNSIIIKTLNSKKDERRKMGSAKSHIKNMIEGLNSEFEYELEICNVHFPITVTYDKAKSEFLVKNFLGEKSPRRINAAKNVDVEIKAPVIKIKSYDLEAAGQTAANLEKITKIRNRDRNKFQDGIFITKKPGKVYS